MGKIRTRILGYEEIERQQKEEQKQRSLDKKQTKGEGSVEETDGETSAVESKNKKQTRKTSKSKVHVRSEKYLKAKAKLDQSKKYLISDAVTLLKKSAYAGFDESLEIHMNVSKQGLKGEVELPFSTGKTVRVKIVDDALLAQLEDGVIEFDVLVTHPSFMPKLAKFARVLGPKGLMPNPKSGTITDKPEEAAAKFAKGTLRWKTEAKFPLVHQMVGKLSASETDLSENAVAFIRAVGRPNVKEVFLATTMGPSLALDIEKI
ncbi:hypothetical protein HGA88_00335 [Candidatus Roizmanbacteria bacterium]|nr:hypothetical protein [Candidatus Roizmanbacteria bacterium]